MQAMLLGHGRWTLGAKRLLAANTSRDGRGGIAKTGRAGGEVVCVAVVAVVGLSLAKGQRASIWRANDVSLLRGISYFFSSFLVLFSQKSSFFMRDFLFSRVP
jgi:hypothetical protein